MTLFLFYAEELKRMLIDSVGAKIREQKKDLKGAKLLKAIFQRLISEELLSQPESEELRDMIEHRNQIAHQIQNLTGDIEIPGRYRFRQFVKLRYDYQALTRVMKWQEVLWTRFDQHYDHSLSFEPLLFEVAEKAYKAELNSLKKRIDRQMAERNKEIADVRQESTPENVRR